MRKILPAILAAAALTVIPLAACRVIEKDYVF